MRLALLKTAGRDGAKRSLLIANGFGVPMINALVSQGLATLTYEKVRAGGKLIDMARSGSRTPARGQSKGDANAARSQTLATA